MTAITIRDVPEETATELRMRAARKGQSLQEYLKGTLVDICRHPDLEVWLDEGMIARRGKHVGVEEILAALDEGRR